MRRHCREEEEKKNNVRRWDLFEFFSFSRMGFRPHPADGGMKPGRKDGVREKECGGCSRRAL